jgi:hypothetical protein
MKNCPNKELGAYRQAVGHIVGFAVAEHPGNDGSGVTGGLKGTIELILRREIARGGVYRGTRRIRP